MTKITKNNENVEIEGFLGVGLTGITAKIHVQGSGTTSGSYTAKFENLSGDTILQIRDDRKIIYTDGNEGDGKVLTSDVNGLAAKTVVHSNPKASVGSNCFICSNPFY